MSRWMTRIDPQTGRVMKSGLNLQPRGVTWKPQSTIYRAVVLKTYATDDADRTADRPNSTRLYEIECDIVLGRSLIPFARVPVLQPSHGVNDADLWIPRPSSRVVGDLSQSLTLQRVSSRGVPLDVPPALDDLDGDLVVVQFIEGDVDMPIITGAMTHSKTKRLMLGGDGWSEAAGGSERGSPHIRERYWSFRGVEGRINDRGDVLLDTVGATQDTETETPAADGGQVRVRVKASERLTIEMDGTDVLEVWRDAQGVHVDIGEGATEKLVRGNRLTTWLLAHQHPNAVGGSGPPIDPAGGVSLVAEDHLSSLHKVV